jgi:ubiquinone/menaquinone biosynthesis C-methylase UbiE
MTTDPRYVPAAGRAALTPLYDRVMALTMREPRWRPQLATAVLDGLGDGDVVVDIGCGTATQAIDLAARRPGVRVIGVDGDPQILDLARAKPGAERVELREGDATALPIADGSAAAVICSLLLHHLPPEPKLAALREARRVIRPGGALHIADWGRPADPLARAGFAVLQLFDGREGTRDHRTGRLPAIVAQAGFGQVARTQELRTIFGTLEIYRCTTV